MTFKCVCFVSLGLEFKIGVDFIKCVDMFSPAALNKNWG